MTDEAPDLRAVHTAALTEVQRLVDGVRSEQLEALTPCGDWDVRLLLGHLVAGNRRFAAAASGASMMAALGEIAPESDSAAYAESARQAIDAWRDPAALDQDKGVMLLTVHLAELLIHGWDLARATGQQPQFGEPILDVVEPFGKALMPTERPDGMGFAPAAEAPDDASRLDRLAAFYGRPLRPPAP